MNRFPHCILLSAAIFLFAWSASGQDAKPVYQGQNPIRSVDTSSRPIERQTRQVFEFEEDGVFFSNDFDGARLNGIKRTGENTFTITITPENFPINMSPWYAFQVWSEQDEEVAVHLEYPNPAYARHRYSPWISMDGQSWRLLEDERIVKGEMIGRDAFRLRPKHIVMTLDIDEAPMWVSAQELQTSSHVFAWMDQLAEQNGIETEAFGKSVEGRPLRILKMGNTDSQQLILVISRQHPPEVTGYLAMKAFVEKLADGSDLSTKFRQQYGIYVAPLMNPDGVDHGHWRHNVGGIDLNRDWLDFNQPETKALSNYLKELERDEGAMFLFGIDFHSTWDDIYYPNARTFTDTHRTGLVWDWLDRIQDAIPDYKPNILPSTSMDQPVTSKSYFYASHKMESITYEIGDNTPREFIALKGEVGAVELMKLLLED